MGNIVNSEPFPQTPAEGPKTGGIKQVADLVPDPDNRRTHTLRNVEMVVEALRQVRAARSVVIDENDVILAGNATVMAAMEAGITKVQVIDTDGETLIAVRRSGLSPEQKRNLSLFDNRSSELAEWNVAQLAADAADGLDLTAFFDGTELSDLLGEAAPVPEFAAVDQAEQGRLDQLQSVVCPNCGHAFTR